MLSLLTLLRICQWACINISEFERTACFFSLSLATDISLRSFLSQGQNFSETHFSRSGACFSRISKNEEVQCSTIRLTSSLLLTMPFQSIESISFIKSAEVKFLSCLVEMFIVVSKACTKLNKLFKRKVIKLLKCLLLFPSRSKHHFFQIEVLSCKDRRGSRTSAMSRVEISMPTCSKTLRHQRKIMSLDTAD